MAEITYSRVSDYLIPDIVLREPPPGVLPPIGRYSRMRQTFLKVYRPILYSEQLLSERLYPHLREIQREAENRLESIISDILVFNPPPDKAADGLAWAAHMEAAHRTAEKIMLDEVVYI